MPFLFLQTKYESGLVWIYIELWTPVSLLTNDPIDLIQWSRAAIVSSIDYDFRLHGNDVLQLWWTKGEREGGREGGETCYHTKITSSEISATLAVALCNVSMIIREGCWMTGCWKAICRFVLMKGFRFILVQFVVRFIYSFYLWSINCSGRFTKYSTLDILLF